MRKIMKSAFILVISTIICSCGSNRMDEKREGNDNVFMSTMNTEISIIHEDGEEEVHSVRTNNGKVILKTVSLGKSQFYFVDDNNYKSLFKVFDTAYTDILDYALDREGNTYFILLEVMDGKEDIYLKKCFADGEEANIKWLNDFHKGNQDDCYEWNLTLTFEGNILVYSDFGYILIDPSGETVKQDRWEKKQSYNVMCVEEDLIFVQHYTEFDFKKLISKVDISTSRLQTLNNIQSNIYFDFIKYTGNTILMRSESELLQYNYREGSIKSLFRWSDYGIIGDNILMLYMKNNQLHCLMYEKETLYDVTLPENENGGRKKQLTLGCIGEDITVRNAVVEFNKSNSDYIIKVVDYWNGNEELSINNMYNDILAGKGPDIIKMDNYIDDVMLGQKGVLEDLNIYLDKSSVIGKEDIVESIYQSLLYGDKLYILPSNFEMDTMITKKKWLSEAEGWSVNNLLSILEKEEITEFSLNKDYVLYYYVLSCVELTGNAEDDILDTDILRKYLELANYMPDITVYNPEDAVRREGKMLFETYGIYCMNTYMYAKASWGEDSIFAGFPDAKGNGTMIIPKNGYGICSRSLYKEKAWEFIENFFEDDWQEKITPNYDFSTVSEVLDMQLETSMKFEVYTDGEGKKQEIPILEYPSGGEYIQVYAARENDVNDLKNMINGTEIVRRNKSYIIKIVQEEAAYYFSGQKSIDDVIKIIENRVGLFIRQNTEYEDQRTLDS